MIMTVSPPGHEHYFEELVKLAARGSRPDAGAIAALRGRYDTEQLYRAQFRLATGDPWR
jgi:hypothetical protein